MSDGEAHVNAEREQVISTQASRSDEPSSSDRIYCHQGGLEVTTNGQKDSGERAGKGGIWRVIRGRQQEAKVVGSRRSGGLVLARQCSR